MVLSKGGLSETEILKMPLKRFFMYNDYFTYIHRAGTEEGIKKNKMLDRTDQLKYGGKQNNEDDNMKQLKRNLKI